jgi:hypothetical protein
MLPRRQQAHVVGRGGGLNQYQGAAADGAQSRAAAELSRLAYAVVSHQPTHQTRSS